MKFLGYIIADDKINFLLGFQVDILYKRKAWGLEPHYALRFESKDHAYDNLKILDIDHPVYILGLHLDGERLVFSSDDDSRPEWMSQHPPGPNHH